MHPSPRLEAVRRHADQLFAIADSLGARAVALCGSVGRGTDHERSDIDFYVHDFTDDRGIYARVRADHLVRQFRRALAPYDVDIRGIPGWLVEPEYEAVMRADSIDLRVLRDGPQRCVWPAPGTADLANARRGPHVPEARYAARM